MQSTGMRIWLTATVNQTQCTITFVFKNERLLGNKILCFAEKLFVINQIILLCLCTQNNVSGIITLRKQCIFIATAVTYHAHLKAQTLTEVAMQTAVCHNHTIGVHHYLINVEHRHHPHMEYIKYIFTKKDIGTERCYSLILMYRFSDSKLKLPECIWIIWVEYYKYIKTMNEWLCNFEVGR